MDRTATGGTATGGTATGGTAMGQAYALVVGIAHYATVTSLPSSVLDDARDVYDLLVDPTRGGYPPANVTLLLDTAATTAALRAALGELGDRGGPDSSVFVYFSGHGGRVDTGSGATSQFLIPTDTVVDSPASLASTAISGEELTAALGHITSRKVLVVFDCCHAGGIGALKGVVAPAVKAGLPETFYETLQSGRGRAIMASSRSSELSWILPGARNSLFTNHLLDGLRGGVPSDDGMVRVFDLFEYLQPRVTGNQPAQHPVFKADLEENFPVALRLGGEKAVAAKDSDGYRFDAYVSYVDREPDSTWVWETLLPQLEQAGLRVAVSGDVEEPGVERVVGIERGVRQAKRTIVVLSPAYLDDGLAHFENVLAQTMGVQEGTYRLLPMQIADLGARQLPVRLSMLTVLDMTRPARVPRQFERLVSALQGRLPTRSE